MLTSASFSISGKSSSTRTAIRAAGILTVGIHVTHGKMVTALVDILEKMKRKRKPKH